MLQLRGLQHDSKHEELQGLRQEPILQCVSHSHALIFILKFYFSFYPRTVFSLRLRDSGCSVQSEHTLKQEPKCVCVCLCLCACYNPTVLFLSFSLHCCLSVSVPAHTPPPQSAGRICAVGKCLHFSSSSSNGREGRGEAWGGCQQRKFLKFLYSDTGGHAES